MVKQNDIIEMKGKVLEVLADGKFKIRLENGHEVLGILSGRMKMNKIRVLTGDNVLIELTPYDLTKGRVTRRL